MAIEEIRGSKVRWINLTDLQGPNCPEIKFLKKNFSLHRINLEDSLAIGQRPKIDIYHDNLFLVLLYPVYIRNTGAIVAREIDFFISKGFIITIHDNKLPIIERYFNHLKKQKNYKEKNEFLANNVMIVLYELLNKLISHCFPMLDHISMDINRAEKHIFKGKEKEMVKEILASRRNIVHYRKTMSAHKNILKKLGHANSILKIFDPQKSDVYFNNLTDKTKDIWDSLESFKESIEALHDTNESLISFRLNIIMKTFTIISVVIFVLTLVATILGLDAPGTPLISWPLGFWLIILLEVIVAMIVVSIFKSRKWLE